MKRHTITSAAMAVTFALLVMLTGCDREISSSSTSKTTTGDGAVKTQEQSVSTSSDGVVTKEESKSTTTPR